MVIDRIKRLSEILKQEISIILQEEVNDPRINRLTITEVELSRDLRSLGVLYVTSANEADKVRIEKGLRSSCSFVRGRLTEKVPMKFSPKISFREDLAAAKKEHIDNIFDKIKKEGSQKEDHPERI